MQDSLRLFNCARCKCQTLICRYCDRGHIYCSPLCSYLSRRAALSAAGKRYQQSFKGALNHAKRQQKYRARQCQNDPVIKKVTHQGSPESGCHDVVKAAAKMPGSCHFCHSKQSDFIRWTFYKRRGGFERRAFYVLAQGP